MPGSQDDKTQLDPAIKRLIQDEIDRQVDRNVKNLKLLLWLAGILIVAPIGSMVAFQGVSDFVIGQRIDGRVEAYLKANKGDSHIDGRVDAYMKAKKGDPHFNTFLNKTVAYSYSGWAILDPDKSYFTMRFYKSDEDSGELRCKANFRNEQTWKLVNRIDIELNGNQQYYFIDVNTKPLDIQLEKDFTLDLRLAQMFKPRDKPEPWHELKISLAISHEYNLPKDKISNAPHPAEEIPKASTVSTLLPSIYVDVSCVVAVYGAALQPGNERVAQRQ